ncbi:MAG: RHS repeat-associated core domain-containing protein [Chloroflexota bacterium]|nr:RHS repeat-associated core domain-containing protein [Chloroflexota bacterium]
MNYLLGDHLGSTSLVTDSAGVKINEQRYKAWGETRYTFGNEKTKYQYTGQFSYTADFGLYFYNARWYDPALGRFAQADTIIPSAYDSQSYDRFAYVFNNPIKYNDPSGHIGCDEDVNGKCIPTIKSLESQYDIKLTGGWNQNELLILNDALSKLAAHVGGADNLNDVFHDALDAHNIDADRLIFDKPKQENCPGNAQACWLHDQGTISLSDAAFSAQYQTRPGAFRPAELGLKGNIEASIQVTIVHEIGHVFADARPASVIVYRWRVPNPGKKDNAEERMANTIAFYVISGMENWPGKPDHFDFVRDITALWQATP